MRALVTGGSGFIGSHVVDRLLKAGADVRIFDMVHPTHHKDVDYYQGTLLDREHIGFALADVDCVFHLAAVADVNDFMLRPLDAENVNVRGTLNVLEAMRNAGVRRLIYGSTVWVYSGLTDSVVTEATPLLPPKHLYTASKLAGEHYARCYAEVFGLEVTYLRYGIPYGPRARSAAVVPAFVQRALRGEPLTIEGTGEQTRRFVYVEDLAEANVLCLKPQAVGQIYNAEGIEDISILRIAKAVQAAVGNVEIQFKPGRPADFKNSSISSDKIFRELGWKPTTSFEEGLNHYVNWYRQSLASKKPLSL